ncbi:MAG TPA: hypothetical protein VGP30_04010, partial [Candidatus Limnocylindrales bacterium]|nr:hypothetical protein [Candidatus Limnocylindrales bacterium]
MALPFGRFASRGFVPRLAFDEGARDVAGWEASVDAASVSVRFGRNAGVMPASGDGAQPGCQPKIGKRFPHPMIRNCWT